MQSTSTKSKRLMTVSFNISAADFLDYHLYMASKSAIINRKRAIAKYVFAIAYFLLGSWFIFYRKIPLGTIFIVLSLLWFFLFPVLNRNSMRRFYMKYIAENYKNKIKRTTEMIINGDFIFVNDGSSESKIHIREFEKLIEIQQNFFLKLRTGNAYIIPKNQVENDTFKAVIRDSDIPIIEEKNWKWQ